MSEEEKTNQENTEQTEQPKKEGKFSSFFKKVGQKIDDAAYDSRLNSDFGKNHPTYQVYTGTGAFASTPSVSVEEHLDGEEKYVVALTENDVIKAGCLIKKDNDTAVYHITAVEKTTLTIEFEGKSNQKPALKIVLGDQAEKVAVIKVGDDFYKV